MIIARNKIFDDYCEWLFSILDELENRVDTSEYDDYQKRVFGFISERLFNVYLHFNKLKFKSVRVISIHTPIIQRIRNCVYMVLIKLRIFFILRQIHRKLVGRE